LLMISSIARREDSDCHTFAIFSEFPESEVRMQKRMSVPPIFLAE
jgi:hypothetical protein